MKNRPAAQGGDKKRPHHGHGGGPVDPGTAPQAFLDSILRGPAADARAVLRSQYAFNVGIGPEFDRGMVEQAMVIATGLTEGRVGFVIDPKRPVEVAIKYVPHSEPGWLAATYRRIAQQSAVVLGWDVVYGVKEGRDQYGRRVSYTHDAIKVLIHEFTHGLCLGHCEGFGRPCVMGGADEYQKQYDPWEFLAAKQLRFVPADAVARSAHLVTPPPVVCYAGVHV